MRSIFLSLLLVGFVLGAGEWATAEPGKDGKNYFGLNFQCDPTPGLSFKCPHPLVCAPDKARTCSTDGRACSNDQDCAKPKSSAPKCLDISGHGTRIFESEEQMLDLFKPFGWCGNTSIPCRENLHCQSLKVCCQKNSIGCKTVRESMPCPKNSVRDAEQTNLSSVCKVKESAKFCDTGIHQKYPNPCKDDNDCFEVPRCNTFGSCQIPRVKPPPGVDPKTGRGHSSPPPA